MHIIMCQIYCNSYVLTLLYKYKHTYCKDKGKGVIYSEQTKLSICIQLRTVYIVYLVLPNLNNANIVS